VTSKSGISSKLTNYFYQFQKWTGIKPLYEDARAAVMGTDP
jgi:hypothetical protein